MGVGNSVRFAYFDGDDVGSMIEVSLMDDDVSEACHHSQLVNVALRNVLGAMEGHPRVEVLFSGGDDILAVWPDGALGVEDLERIREVFRESCGRTMSIGVGKSASDALRNLRRAKLSGKNRIAHSGVML